MRHATLDAPGNGLRLRVHRFDEPEVPASGLTLLLCHGYMDAGGTWDLVAPYLTARGHCLLAPDLRGFGGSDGVGAGGYYHFLDYVADLDALARALVPHGARLGLVGHSMGGTVSCLLAGARPKRFERVALLEGLGVPETAATAVVDRTRTWLSQLSRFDAEARTRAALPSEAAALSRLTANHPSVDPAVLATRLPWLLRTDEEGRLVWAYDPLHRTTSPLPVPLATFRAFLSAIECPALVVGGGPTGFQLPDGQERARLLRDVRIVELDDAGHMMHWTRPAELGALLAAFFDGGPLPPRGA